MTQLTAKSTLARADQPETSRVLLIDPGMPALVLRLREEIESLGLEVRSVPAGERAESLEARTRAADALAAIRITPSGGGAVEMTIVDRATGKTVSRRLAIAMPSDPASAELIATRTVELLRASLMELTADHPPRGEVAASPELQALTSEHSAAAPALRPALALGAAVVTTPGLAASGDLALAFTVLWRERLGVTAQVFVPVTGSALATREGQVEIFTSSYRLGAAFSTAVLPKLSARLHAGLFLSRLSLSGFAEPPHSGVHDDVTAWGPWSAAGVGFELSRSLGAWAAADAAFALPRTVIRSAGREVLSWGRPLIAGSAGLELAWP